MRPTPSKCCILFFFQINILQSIIVATIETRNYLKIVTNWPLNVDIHFEVKNRIISQRGGAGDTDRFQNLFSLLYFLTQKKIWG